MSFDKIFDLTAGVYFNFYNMLRSIYIASRLRSLHCRESRLGNLSSGVGLRITAVHVNGFFMISIGGSTAHVNGFYMNSTGGSTAQPSTTNNAQHPLNTTHSIHDCENTGSRTTALHKPKHPTTAQPIHTIHNVRAITLRLRLRLRFWLGLWLELALPPHQHATRKDNVIILIGVSIASPPPPCGFQPI